jgi:hypothetical protein
MATPRPGGPAPGAARQPDAEQFAVDRPRAQQDAALAAPHLRADTAVRRSQIVGAAGHHNGERHIPGAHPRRQPIARDAVGKRLAVVDEQ